MMRSLLLVALCAAAVAIPAPAVAHEGLQRSVPAKDAHLNAAPQSLRLTFTSAPRLSLVRVQLAGPDGELVALSELRLDSIRTVVADITGPLAGGAYTVAWQITGADGHPVRGRYSFVIAPGAAGLGVSHAEDTTAAFATAPDTAATHHDPTLMPAGPGFDAESAGYVAIRWAMFTSVIALLGAIAFHSIVLPLLRWRMPLDRAAAFTRIAQPRSAALGAVMAAVLLAAVIARLFAQSVALHGTSAALDASLIRGMLFQTGWGWAWLAQFAAVAIALGALLRARSGRSMWWGVAVAMACVIPFTMALSGHAAAAQQWAPLALVADGLHVFGAAGWLGGLFAVMVVGIPSAMSLEPSNRGGAIADVVNAFSPTALLFAGLAALTGVFSGWLHLGSVPALWTSAYGRTLLLKLGVLSLVALTGAYNWLRVRPMLPQEKAGARLRKSAGVELAVAVIVIAITAVLVATPPPADAMGTTQ